MELEHRAADLVGARARDGVDDAAGRAAVLRGVGVGEHGELGHRLDAQVGAEGVARRRVGVVVDADAVEAVVVLRRAGAGDGHLHAVARARAAAAADADDAGLQHRELRPVAAVQRQLADGRAAHVVPKRRRHGVDRAAATATWTFSLTLPTVMAKSIGSSAPTVSVMPLFVWVLNPSKVDRDLVRARQQVGRAVEPVGVRHDLGHDAGRDVADRHAGVRQRRAALIARRGRRTFRRRSVR